MCLVEGSFGGKYNALTGKTSTLCKHDLDCPGDLKCDYASKKCMYDNKPLYH